MNHFTTFCWIAGYYRISWQLLVLVLYVNDNNITFSNNVSKKKGLTNCIVDSPTAITLIVRIRVIVSQPGPYPFDVIIASCEIGGGEGGVLPWKHFLATWIVCPHVLTYIQGHEHFRR